MSRRLASGRGHVRGLALFVVGYALVDVLPVVLPEWPTFANLRVADLADLLLIFPLVALYAQLGSRADLFRSVWLRIVFAFLLAMMIQGHSIHLAGNAIAAVTTPASPGWDLIYFLDEHWGHAELHLSFLAIAALFIGAAGATGADLHGVRRSRAESLGMFVITPTYGLLLAADAVEGQTVPLVLPAAMLLCVWGLWPYLRGMGNPGRPPVSIYRWFFAIAMGIAALSLVAYGMANGGFPEFSGLALEGE